MAHAKTYHDRVFASSSHATTTSSRAASNGLTGRSRLSSEEIDDPGSLTWSKGGFQIGSFVNYVASVDDTNFLDANGIPYVVEGQATVNLYAQYRVKGGALDDTRFRIGARNLFDKDPPITAEGYLGALYVPYARYVYASIGKRF